MTCNTLAYFVFENITGFFSKGVNYCTFLLAYFLIVSKKVEFKTFQTNFAIKLTNVIDGIEKVYRMTKQGTVHNCFFSQLVRTLLMACMDRYFGLVELREAEDSNNGYDDGS